jgi:enoyl-CoA hydratase
MTREVILERSDGIALIRLDAPARRNALTVSMARDLIAVCDEVDADPSIGAVVITSSSSYFCAGGDRATLQDAGEGPADPDRFDSMGVIYRSYKRV